MESIHEKLFMGLHISYISCSIVALFLFNVFKGCFFNKKIKIKKKQIDSKLSFTCVIHFGYHSNYLSILSLKRTNSIVFLKKNKILQSIFY